MIRRIGLLSALAMVAALSLIATTPSAGSSVTIGQLAPGSPPTATCTGGDSDFVQQPNVGSGSAYVVPSLPPATSLVISSWSTNAAAPSGATYVMKLFRRVADPATYMAVGHDVPRTLTGGTLNTFPVSIPVTPGDLLGFFEGGNIGNACVASAPGESANYENGNLGDGESEAFTSSLAGRLNISAVVTPLNTFSLGTITPNKKKGTATVTADVPNPGELTGSGNGVKASSASGAVISKSVGAGQAQLLIKAKGKKKRKLSETGKVKLNVAITYTPTGGDPATQSVKVKLKKKL